jgi:cytochrome c5
MGSVCTALASPSITAPHHHKGPNAYYPKVDYGTGATYSRIKRGEYLVTSSDCVACHTTEGGGRFAGGLGLETPFGTIYAPNITPDKTTGIGSWSDEDFIRAMRHGISPSGDYYFPVFPYLHFNKMSRQDILDMKAYLDRIPAIKKANLEPDMPFPFNLRQLQFFWREMFFHKHTGQWQPTPDKSQPWNRGQYLVEGPAHCGMCHTPINIMGGQLTQFAYKGGFVDGYHAPDISASHLGDVPIDKVIRVFTHDERIEGGKISSPPMLQANHESLSFLSKDDLRSMVVYLQSVESKALPEAGHSDVIDDTTGKNIYNKYCTGCHTTGAGGAPKFGDHAAWSKRLQKGLETVHLHAIQGYENMPAKGGCTNCSDAEVQAATDYLIQLKALGDDMGESKPMGQAPKALTLADGKRIYQQKTCHLCHDSGSQGAPILGDKQAWAARIAQNMDVLYAHTIHGYNNMPARGACVSCSDAEIMAATKYMVQQSKEQGDYALW